MNAQEKWNRTNWTDAAQIAQFIDPDRVPPGAAGLPPQSWFGQLLSAGQLNDAVSFMAHALPRYECVIWMARSLIESGAVDRRDPLVVAVLRWIDDPCEDLRRAVEKLLNGEVVTSPAYMLAKAAFMSGGSISLAEYPPVLAPPDASAKFAAGAVFDAAFISGNPASLLRQATEIGDAMASQASQR